MIYGVGIVGFIGGFIFGQMVLYFLLRHKTNEELLNDRWLKIKYGLLGWGCAALGAYSFVEIYKQYFPVS
ncbi:MAG: hypothetical protein H6861_09100 [Rhodospirillales bacterium]|nr:hypothetical protein [Rhodospirillales bacterium]